MKKQKKSFNWKEFLCKHWKGSVLAFFFLGGVLTGIKAFNLACSVWLLCLIGAAIGKIFDKIDVFVKLKFSSPAAASVAAAASVPPKTSDVDLARAVAELNRVTGQSIDVDELPDE